MSELTTLAYVVRLAAFAILTAQFLATGLRNHFTRKRYMALTWTGFTFFAAEAGLTALRLYVRALSLAGNGPAAQAILESWQGLIIIWVSAVSAATMAGLLIAAYGERRPLR